MVIALALIVMVVIAPVLIVLVVIALVLEVLVLISLVLIALVLIALMLIVLCACLAKKLAPAEKNSTDISARSAAFCISDNTYQNLPFSLIASQVSFWLDS